MPCRSVREENIGELCYEDAVRAGCAERDVREWLNAQAASGDIDYRAASAI